jgi:hypothetical protein
MLYRHLLGILICIISTNRGQRDNTATAEGHREKNTNMSRPIRNRTVSVKQKELNEASVQKTKQAEIETTKSTFSPNSFNTS